MNMNDFGFIVMFGWVPAVICIFKQIPARKAVVVSFIVAWLFLPTAELKFVVGIPAYTKMAATCCGVLLATILFDAKRFSSLQFGWLDLPMLIWCLCPFISSMTNDLGWYDGISAAYTQTVAWGVPYYLGRVYLSNLEGLRNLTIGIFIGGLSYVPLCLFESRMTFQLHQFFYGFSSGHFLTEFRYGGYRPEVFMETGLMVGAWMMAATLSGFWLWQSGAVKQLWGIPVRWLVATLAITTVLVKSTGAIGLLAVGIMILFVAKWFRNSLLVLVMIIGISIYLYDGVSGSFSGDQIVKAATTYINPDRAQSLEFRFDNEKLLSAQARERMVFGWGGWGRSRVHDPRTGKDISVTDSLWIITFGTTGIIGLISLTASLLLPVAVFVKRYPASLWFNNKVAPAAAIAVLIVLYTVDCLLNAMLNPVYTVACGGLTGLMLGQTDNLSKVMRVHLPVTGR